MELKIGKNQYLLTREKIDCGFARKEFIEDFTLYLGSDCQFFNYNFTIYVIGYAVDVIHPEYSLNEMCNNLTDKIKLEVYGPDATRSWNGRFVVIVKKDPGFIIWHDCCGLKQVFHTINGFDFCIASQARYISKLLNLKESSEAAEYIQMEKKRSKEYSWVLDITNFAEVHRLLPNHYLDSTSREIKRSDIERTDCKGVKETALIHNSLVAASKRRPLAVTLTAGWDSRIVLSGCKGIDHYDVVTLKYHWMEDDDIDVIVASKICEKLGLNHKIIDCELPTDIFWKEYFDHSENGHEYWAQMAQAVTNAGYNDFFWVKGSCNEIIRNSFGVLYNWQVTPELICRLYGLPVIPFVVNTIKDWLNEAKNYCKRNKIKVLDLFYWEHRMGTWLAECLNEADYCGEMFSPFNNREFISIGLSKPVSVRIPPNYDYFRGLIDIKYDNLPKNENRYKSLNSKIKLFLKNRLHILYWIYLLKP